jgi:hypothetical protein
MSISAITSVTNAPALDYSRFQQRLQDFRVLQSSLQAGDLAGAQQAFAAFQKDAQRAAQPSGTTSTLGQSSQASKDFQALQNALQSNDLKGAQQAFATLRQGLKSARQAGKAHHAHRHHRGNGGAAGAISSSSSTANTAIPTQTVGSVNQLA